MNRLLIPRLAAIAFLLASTACQKSFDVPANSSSNNTDNTTTTDNIGYSWELTNIAYPGLKDYEAGSFVISNKAYVLDIQGNLWSLDAGSSTWVKKSSLPFPTPPVPNGYFLISYPIVFSVGEKGYVTCGHWAYQNIGIIDQGSSTTLWEYDPGKDLWSVKAEFPGTGRILPVAVPGGDFALVGMGISQVDSISTASEFMRYTPATNSWTNAPACATGLILGTGFQDDGRSFLVGDKPVPGSSADHDNRLYQFSANTWQEIAPVGSVKDWFTYATTYAQKAIAVSTVDNTSTLTTFNLSTGAIDRHTTLPVPYSSGSTAFIFRLNDKIYLGDLVQKKIWTCKLS